jgi:hypothetical protein
MTFDKKQYLQTMANELHKPVTRHFKRTHIITRGIDDMWSADLADMNEFKDDNDGIRYILTVIDGFSRYAWAVPIKDKTGDTVLKAFKKIISTSDRKPARLNIDQGKEFVNKKMTKWLEDNKITPYHTYSEHKASMIERFNRTLKSIMWKKLTELQSNKWIDILPDLVDEYNNKRHSTIKMSPVEASKKTNEAKLWKQLYGDIGQEQEPPKETRKFECGDWVRISRVKPHFEKGYTTNWTQEIFKIYEKTFTDPPTYKIQDSLGEHIKGSFYAEELQKTALGDVFLVHKVLDERKVGRKKEVLVSWIGYNDPKFNSWIPESNLHSLT